MNLVKSYLTNNPCYKANVSKSDSRYTTFQTRGPLGLVLHSVGVPQPKASVFINAWNKSSYNNACVHGFIDALTGDVYQTLPWNYRGWHGGSGAKGSVNNTHIGVEMCEPSTIKYTSGSNFTDSNPENTKACVLRTYNSAVELFAMLCKQYKLDPLKDGVIISHKEGNTRGIATNHGDPEHIWKKFGLSMDKFRKDVKSKLATSGTVSESITSPSVPTVNYKVRVTVDSLNIRTGPGTSYKVVDTIEDEGVYTIIEESNGWGKLKSKVGWISLKYTKKV